MKTSSARDSKRASDRRERIEMNDSSALMRNTSASTANSLSTSRRNSPAGARWPMLRSRHVDNQCENHCKKDHTRADGTEAQSAVGMRLRQQVAERCTERPGEDVRDPERQDGMALEQVVAEGHQRDAGPEDQGGAEVAHIGDEIAGGRPEREREQDRRPVEQLNSSRRVVKMVWIDKVFSLAYQSAKVSASAAAKTSVVTCSGTPKLSVKLSVMSVPATLIRTTDTQ